jgi:hypothetical protein
MGLCFFINEFGANSVSLHAHNMWNRFCISLYAPQATIDINLLSKSLQEGAYYDYIKSKFDHLDFIGPETHECKFVEYVLEIDKFAWFAHYKTTEIVEQTIAKINRFREDSDFTNMLIELNKIGIKK